MNENKPDLILTDTDDAPEITAEMIKSGTWHQGKKLIVREQGEAAFRRVLGRPKSANPKQATTIRLSPEVLTYFKRDGRGWQSRIDNALKEWVSKQV